VIRGVVLSAETGEAIEGALVFLDAEGLGEVDVDRAARADADGAFELPRVDGVGQVEAIARDHVPASVSLPASAGDLDVVVRMDPGWAVAGVVLDDLDEPVPGALVWAALPANRAAWPRPTRTLLSAGRSAGSSTLSDAGGRFRLGGLREGEEYVVQCIKAGWTKWNGDSLRPTVARARAGDDRIVLHLRPYGGVRLRFVDAENHALLCPHSVSVWDPRGLLGTYTNLPWSAFEEDLPDVSLGEYFCLARDGRRFTDLTAPPLAKVEAKADGYEDVTTEVLVELGSFRIVDVPMMPVKRDGTRPVRFSATLCGRVPYTGPLALRLTQAARGGKDARGGGRVALDFEAGVASEPIAIPVGTWWLHPTGAGTQGGTWIEAGEAVEIVVERGSEPLDVAVDVRGAPYYVRVLDDQGRRASGFSVTSVRGRDRTRRYLWDVCAQAERAPAPIDGPADLSAGPPMWLSPGRTDLYVRVHEVGTGKTTVDCPGDGRARTLEIRLTGR